MKKIMTILGAFMVASVVLTSCGPSSVKGNWTDDDMEKCLADAKKDVNEDPESAAGFQMLGLDLNDFTECICEKAEDEFDSYSEADKISDDEAALLFTPCLGEDFLNLMMSLDSLDLE